MAESFFSALKNERVYRTVYATKAQARRDVIAYIESSTTPDDAILHLATGDQTKSITLRPAGDGSVEKLIKSAVQITI